jgi:peptide/nickel transport system substrate-binding protein
MKTTPSYFANRITRRRMLAVSGAAAGAAVVLACGGAKDGGGATLKPSDVRKPGAVIYARDSWKLADESAGAVAGGVYPDMIADEYTAPFEPVGASQALLQGDLNRIYEYLVRLNRGPGIAPGTPEYATMQPHLTEGWEIAADGLTVTFALRPNVKFQNKTPVNGRVMDIEDWRATYERYRDDGYYRNAFHTPIDKVEFPDSRHMAFRMKYPYAPLLLSLTDTFFGALKIMPKELARADLSQVASNPIGTGALVVDKFQPSVTMEFRRHDEYWQGKPYIDRWHWPRIPEYANRYAQFVAKNVLALSGWAAPIARDALQLHKDAPDAVMVGAELSPTGLRRMPFGRIGVKDAPYNDARVRIALRRSCDFAGITDFLGNKEQFKAAGIDIEIGFMTHIGADPSYWLDPRKGELGKASDNYVYNVAEAKKLMTAAGHSSAVPLDFYQNDAPRQELEELYTLMTDSWHKSGLFKLTRKTVTNVEFSNEILTRSNFGPGIARPNPVGGTDPDAWMSRQLHKDCTATVWLDPKMDDIVERQRKEMDPVKRIEIFKEFQRFQAENFYTFPAEGIVGSFGFWWDWLRNSQYPLTMVHKHWLAKDMPRRNG